MAGRRWGWVGLPSVAQLAERRGAMKLATSEDDEGGEGGRPNPRVDALLAGDGMESAGEDEGGGLEEGLRLDEWEAKSPSPSGARQAPPPMALALDD